MPDECRKGLDRCPNGAGHPSIADRKVTGQLLDPNGKPWVWAEQLGNGSVARHPGAGLSEGSRPERRKVRVSSPAVALQRPLLEGGEVLYPCYWMRRYAQANLLVSPAPAVALGMSAWSQRSIATGRQPLAEGRLAGKRKADDSEE